MPKKPHHPAVPSNFGSIDSYLARRPFPAVTYGEVFDSGASIDVVQNPSNRSLQLHYTEGGDSTISPRILVGGQEFCPPILPASIQQALTFPEKSIQFNSTAQLFSDTYNFFTENGVPSDAGLAATYFTFATWFADVLPEAPCIFISGARWEGTNLLHLLSLVARHSLPIAEFNRRVLTSLPLDLQLTLLINLERLSPKCAELLRSSNHHRAFFLR
jgi:hypothetical protein